MEQSLNGSRLFLNAYKFLTSFGFVNIQHKKAASIDTAFKCLIIYFIS